MGLNRNYIGHEFPEVIHEVTENDIHEYSWAIGARNLTYFNFNGVLSPTAPMGMAPPSFAVIYELPILEKIWQDPDLHGGEEEAKSNVLMLVHGDQHMKFYNPIVPGDKLTFKSKITNIEDKGSGVFLVFNILSVHENGEKAVESDWGLFIRGIGSGKKPSKNGNGRKQIKTEEEKPLAFRKVIRVPNDITYKYAKASNDHNPIHIDDSVAKEAGLKGVIVHGLCTMSMTMRAIIECYLDSDPSKLAELGVRFTSPVYPGDVLIADGWETETSDGKTLLNFEVTRKSDNVKVIKGGKAHVRI